MPLPSNNDAWLATTSFPMSASRMQWDSTEQLEGDHERHS